jgi:hypothetical protein
MVWLALATENVLVSTKLPPDQLEFLQDFTVQVPRTALPPLRVRVSVCVELSATLDFVVFWTRVLLGLNHSIFKPGAVPPPPVVTATLAQAVSPSWNVVCELVQVAFSMVIVAPVRFASVNVVCACELDPDAVR